ALSLDPPAQLDEIEVTRAVGNHVRNGLGQLDEVLDLAIAVRQQRHDRDRANSLERKVDVDELRDVGELDHHAVERTEAELVEVASQALDAAPQLAICDALGSGNQREPVAKRGEDVLKDPGQRSVFPVTLCSIPRDEVGGKRNDAVERHRSSGRFTGGVN